LVFLDFLFFGVLKNDFFGFCPAESPDMDFSAKRTYGLLIGSQGPFKLGLGALSFVKERGLCQENTDFLYIGGSF